MRKAQEHPPQVSAKTSAAAAGALVFFLLVVVLPIGLKATGCTRVATWPWVKVTALLWLPWTLLGVISALGWVIHWVERRRA